MFRFFRTEDPAEARAIARDARRVLLALYGSDRVRFDRTDLLEPVFEEDDARVYRLKLQEP